MKLRVVLFWIPPFKDTCNLTRWLIINWVRLAFTYMDCKINWIPNVLIFWRFSNVYFTVIYAHLLLAFSNQSWYRQQLLIFFVINALIIKMLYNKITIAIENTDPVIDTIMSYPVTHYRILHFHTASPHNKTSVQHHSTPSCHVTSHHHHKPDATTPFFSNSKSELTWFPLGSLTNEKKCQLMVPVIRKRGRGKEERQGMKKRKEGWVEDHRRERWGGKR